MQNKPYGKGLSGFIFGLLLATLIIGVVLYFLNNTPSGIRQPEEPETEIRPEILTPRQERRAEPEPRPGDTASGSGRYALPPGDITDKPPVAASMPQQASTPAQRPEDKPEQDKPAQTKPREQQRKPEPEAKPTPEQILESGNVERAREQARRQRREAEAKAAREAEAKAARETKAAEPRGSRSNAEPRGGNGRYIVQMGSYNNPQAADTQRAKLAMLGVNARVASSKRSDGQTVYRIQSGRLSRAEAQALSEHLRGNGVDTLTRQAD